MCGSIVSCIFFKHALINTLLSSVCTISQKKKKKKQKITYMKNVPKNSIYMPKPQKTKRKQQQQQIE
jgi:Mor family transcriptional regulator